jgi:heme/copper-type cytochrome/quinol oxidase subunit 2
MFCVKCGVNNTDGVSNCVSCGNAMESGFNPVQSPAPAPAPAPSYNSGYNQYSAQPARDQYLEAPVTVGNWMLTYLVLGLPVVGLIMMFVWAFGGNTPKSKANLCKAVLIWTAIIVGLYIISAIIMAAFFGTMLGGLADYW